jgi:hypothetical protein
MINLHIKGDMAAAFKAADKRHIELTSIACRYRGGIAECFASAANTIHPHFREGRLIDFVREWYHEDADIIDGYGYPDGTLLHFSHNEEQPYS